MWWQLKLWWVHLYKFYKQSGIKICLCLVYRYKTIRLAEYFDLMRCFMTDGKQGSSGWFQYLYKCFEGIKLIENFNYTAQKMKFSITDFFSKCDQIRRKLKSVLEKFNFCTVLFTASYWANINLRLINRPSLHQQSVLNIWCY